MTVLRDKLHGLVDEIVDAIEANGAADWVDQEASPLGRQRHLALARRGVLRSTKLGRRVLVRRADIDAFLTKQAVVVVDEAASEEREVSRLVTMLGRKRRSA